MGRLEMKEREPLSFIIMGLDREELWKKEKWYSLKGIKQINSAYIKIGEDERKLGLNMKKEFGGNVIKLSER
jgi:hypothetical protein